jgi:hypothetical protein
MVDAAGASSISRASIAEEIGRPSSLLGWAGALCVAPTRSVTSRARQRFCAARHACSLRSRRAEPWATANRQLLSAPVSVQVMRDNERGPATDGVPVSLAGTDLGGITNHPGKVDDRRSESRSSRFRFEFPDADVDEAYGVPRPPSSRFSSGRIYPDAEPPLARERADARSAPKGWEAVVAELAEPARRRVCGTGGVAASWTAQLRGPASRRCP